MLGPGNEEAAKEGTITPFALALFPSALCTFPGGFHIGGGINHLNALHYLGLWIPLLKLIVRVGCEPRYCYISCLQSRSD